MREDKGQPEHERGQLTIYIQRLPQGIPLHCSLNHSRLFLPSHRLRKLRQGATSRAPELPDNLQEVPQSLGPGWYCSSGGCVTVNESPGGGSSGRRGQYT